MKIILKSVIGSRAYGTDHENSDWDRRYIFMIPTTDLFKLKAPPEDEGDVSNFGFELRKFVHLSAGGSPNPLEMLFSKYVEPVTPEGQILLDNREAFLSQLMVKRFVGHAHGNLKRYEGNAKSTIAALRLLKTCRTLLATGVYEVEVNPTYKEMAENLRTGKTPPSQYETLLRMLLGDIRNLEKTTKLPKEPNWAKIDEMLINLRLGYL